MARVKKGMGLGQTRQRGHHVRCVDVVIDDQHASGRDLDWSRLLERALNGQWSVRQGRKRDRELSALARPVAVHRDASSVAFHELPGECQPDTEAASARLGRSDLHEHAEDLG